MISVLTSLDIINALVFFRYKLSIAFYLIAFIVYFLKELKL